MKDLEEQRVCIKFCLKLGKTFTETFQMLQQAYGEDCLSRTLCHEWYQCLKSGRTSIKDDPKSGWPSTSMDDNHVEKMHAVIHQNRRLTVHEVAKEVGVCKSSCHLILTDKLKVRCVAAKFVLCLLTDAQKENCVTVSQELFDCSNADENFMKNVTGDETWMYGYDVETKVRSSQWMGKLSPRPKKACQSCSNVKVMMIFCFSIGRVSFIMSLFHLVRQSIKSST